MEATKKYKLSLYAMTVFYLGAGAFHFIDPGFYYAIMPDWLPAHELANYSGGIVEIILAILLLAAATKKFAAWMIIAMLTFFFFVIHIPMLFMFYGKDNFMFWVAVIRIPLQLLLIRWAFQFTRKAS